MEAPPGDATWKEKAVGTTGGATAPWVWPHPSVATLPKPSAWWFVVGLGAQPCRWLAQIGWVGEPLSLFAYFAL